MLIIFVLIKDLNIPEKKTSLLSLSTKAKKHTSAVLKLCLSFSSEQHYFKITPITIILIYFHMSLSVITSVS